MSTPNTGSENAPIVSAFADDPDMAELVTYFVGELDERVDSIRSALEAMDCDSLRRMSHQLKGAAGGYGFAPIGEAAAAVETAALSDEADVNELRERTETLIDVCRRAIAR